MRPAFLPLLAFFSAATFLLYADDAPLDSVQDLVGLMGPRVVAIHIERESTDDTALHPRFIEQLKELPPTERENLKSYFRRPGGPVTGLLIDDDGHILTSSYNVEGSLESLTVVLSNGDTLDARVVASDRVADLALVKVDKKPVASLQLPELRWAQNEDFQTGSLVFSLGRSPDPSSTTVTMGIISAPARQYGRIFQTDAALNYGNVGGPLVTVDGRILGIAGFVGHRYPIWGLNSGIGFGTRADTVLEILPRLKKGQSITSPAFLGVRASSDENSNEVGARIAQAIDGLPAASAGLRANDIIVEFGGQSVRDFEHLRQLIFDRLPGDRVPVKVKREEALKEFVVSLSERPRDL